MVEQRPFKALVVGSSPTQPNWISPPCILRETAPEAAKWQLELRANKAGEGVNRRGQKRQNGHENLEKQQQVWMRGSEVVQSPKLLSGLGSGKIVGKEKRLPPIL
jgi:hypothetical protein